MSTTTALIMIGHSHPNHSGIIPTHMIRLTENSRPALILQSINSTNSKPKVIIPSVENTVDDIYLMISTYILRKVKPSVELHHKDRLSIYDLLSTQERFDLYDLSKESLTGAGIKVVFNVLEYSVLLNQLNIIDSYSAFYEITTPYAKKERGPFSDILEMRKFK